MVHNRWDGDKPRRLSVHGHAMAGRFRVTEAANHLDHGRRAGARARRLSDRHRCRGRLPGERARKGSGSNLDIASEGEPSCDRRPEGPRSGIRPRGTAPARGVAVALGIEDAAGIAVEIRWPNDVVAARGMLAAGRKLAGLLCEAHGDAALVGFGVNCAQASFPDEIALTACSLLQVCGRILPASSVLSAILSRLKAARPTRGGRKMRARGCIGAGRPSASTSPVQAGLCRGFCATSTSGAGSSSSSATAAGST